MHQNLARLQSSRPGKEVLDEIDEGSELAYAIAEAAMAKKALDPVIIDVRELATYAEYLVICTGRNDRHVHAIAVGIDGEIGPHRLLVGREGLGDGQWVLLDYGDVIVHVFCGPARRHFDLEALWSDVPRLPVEVPEELQGEPGLYAGYSSE